MRIGVPKESKSHEYRVGLVPASVREFVQNGHEVFVQKGAGEGIFVSNEEYRKAGARVLESLEEIFAASQMIVKVKEPQPDECLLLKQGQILFTFLHLAPDPTQTQALCDSGCTAIAYETVTDAKGALPLLAPMSEIAGRMSIQVGAHAMETAQGGRGILISGVPGVNPGKVVVIGAGVSGTSAARIAQGVGADISILDLSVQRLRQIEEIFQGKVKTAYATKATLEHLLDDADLVVGAVLVPGASAPKLISREMLKRMKKGAVIVDIAIDQGGCLETSRPTTHENPTFVEEGIIHYCVTNMPGVVAQTSSYALNNATLPYAKMLADLGWKAAVAKDEGLKNGVNVHAGKIVCKTVAEELGKPYSPLQV